LLTLRPPFVPETDRSCWSKPRRGTGAATSLNPAVRGPGNNRAQSDGQGTAGRYASARQWRRLAAIPGRQAHCARRPWFVKRLARGVRRHWQAPLLCSSCCWQSWAFVQLRRPTHRDEWQHPATSRGRGGREFPRDADAGCLPQVGAVAGFRSTSATQVSSLSGHRDR